MYRRINELWIHRRCQDCAHCIISLINYNAESGARLVRSIMAVSTLFFTLCIETFRKCGRHGCSAVHSSAIYSHVDRKRHFSLIRFVEARKKSLRKCGTLLFCCLFWWVELSLVVIHWRTHDRIFTFYLQYQIQMDQIVSLFYISHWCCCFFLMWMTIKTFGIPLHENVRFLCNQSVPRKTSSFGIFPTQKTMKSEGISQRIYRRLWRSTRFPSQTRRSQ